MRRIKGKGKKLQDCYKVKAAAVKEGHTYTSWQLKSNGKLKITTKKTALLFEILHPNIETGLLGVSMSITQDTILQYCCMEYIATPNNVNTTMKLGFIFPKGS